jgi:hypothetical protein
MLRAMEEKKGGKLNFTTPVKQTKRSHQHVLFASDSTFFLFPFILSHSYTLCLKGNFDKSLPLCVYMCVINVLMLNEVQQMVMDSSSNSIAINI